MQLTRQEAPLHWMWPTCNETIHTASTFKSLWEKLQDREGPYHISHVGLEFKLHRGAENIVVHLHEALLVTGGI